MNQPPSLLSPSAAGLDLGPLRSGFNGRILTAEDGQAYDVARMAFNGMFDRRPAVLARATCTADVVQALEFARAADLAVAVRGGGHSVAGYSTIEGGLLLDLGPMKGIDVDPVARLVRVQPGVVWGELDRATQAHGLATTGGRMTTTGDRRLRPRQRQRLAGAAVRIGVRQPARRRGRHRLRRPWSPPASPNIRICCGACAAAAATSASSPNSPSGCTPSGPKPAAAC